MKEVLLNIAVAVLLFLILSEAYLFSSRKISAWAKRHKRKSFSE